MTTHRLQKAKSEYVSKSMKNGRPSKNSKPLMTAIFWIGITLVSTFALWTCAMVLLEAFYQWKQ